MDLLASLGFQNIFIGVVATVATAIALKIMLVRPATSEAVETHTGVRDPHYPELVERKAIFIRGGVGGFWDVVGESNYHQTIKAIPKAARENFWAELRPEPENPHDEMAIAVLYRGKTIGYLPRDDARLFHRINAETIQEGRPIAVQAKTTGGTSEKPNFGILLDFDHQGRRYKRLPGS